MPPPTSLSSRSFLAVLLALLSVQTTRAAEKPEKPEKPVEKSIPAVIPEKAAEEAKENASPNAPKIIGTTSLVAPDDESPLRYIVPNKKRVSKGELLALFDNSALHTALQSAQTELKALKKATAAAEAEAAALEAAAGEKIANADFEIRKAEKALSKYIEGDAPATEITLALALADAEANFQQQTERYNVRDKMLEEGYIHKVEYDNEERLLKRTRLLRDAAKLKLDAFLKYDREQAIDQLTRTLNDKKAALEKVQRDQVAAVAKAQRAITACGKAEQAKASECAALSKAIEATIILSPSEGVFAYNEAATLRIGKPLTRGCPLGKVQ